MSNEVMIPEGNLPDSVRDPYAYANDEFVKEIVNIKKEVARVLRNLTVNQRYIVKETAKGVTQSDVARELGCSSASVCRTLKVQKVVNAINLVMHYELMLDAPLELQRKNMLWRIAVDNEKKAANVAISAVDKLNQMTNTYNTGGGGNGGSINIVINNANLARGALDQ